jgi:hypothetical protein
MGKMGQLYMQIMEANNYEFPEDVDLHIAAEMNRLKIYNKEEYEKWKKSHPENGEIGSENTKNTKKK